MKVKTSKLYLRRFLFKNDGTRVMILVGVLENKISDSSWLVLFFSLTAEGPFLENMFSIPYGMTVAHWVGEKGYESTDRIFESQYKLCFLFFPFCNKEHANLATFSSNVCSSAICAQCILWSPHVDVVKTHFIYWYF